MIWTYPYELITGITRTIIKVISIIVHSNYKVNRATHGNNTKQSYVSFGFPIEWTRISLSEKNNKLSARNFIAFKPYLTLQQVLTSNLTVNLSSSISTDDNSLDFYALKPFREGYRNIQVTGNDIYKSTHLYTSLHFRYRNLATMLFANLSLTYSDTRSEAYCNYEYNDSMTIMKWVRGSNHRHNIAINAMLDKTFIPIGVSLKFDATYNRDSYLVSQSGVMVNNHSHHASGTLTTSSKRYLGCAYQSLLQLNITGNKVVS